MLWHVVLHVFYEGTEDTVAVDGLREHTGVNKGVNKDESSLTVSFNVLIKNPGPFCRPRLPAASPVPECLIAVTKMHSTL